MLTLLLLASVLAACAPQGARGSQETFSPEPVPTGAPTTDVESSPFPSVVSSDGRSFETAGGTPWFGKGDTAWSLLVELDDEEAERYLDDRMARGFNLVLVNAIEHMFASNAPANAYGDLPFTGEAFQSPPDERYWDHVERVVQMAQERGITMLICPAYLGYGPDEGWASELTAAQDQDVAAFGSYLRQRLGGYPNVMWLIGHDRVPDETEKAREEALAAELPEDDLVGLGAFQTDDILGSRPWQPTSIRVDFETIYSYAETPVEDTWEAWRSTPRRPIVFLEGLYEQEHDVGLGADVLRAQTYGPWAAGASGAIFGNNPIWHFGSVGIYPNVGSWEENLGSPGSVDAQAAWEAVASVPWWDTRPDIDGQFLVGGAGSGRERAAASYSTTSAILYVPTSRELRLDLTQLTGTPRVRIERVDPRSGARETLASPTTDHAVDLADQGVNSAGTTDWVIFVSSQG